MQNMFWENLFVPNTFSLMNNDYFCSLVGIVLVNFSDSQRTKGHINYGGFFALAGAILWVSLVIKPHELIFFNIAELSVNF